MKSPRRLTALALAGALSVALAACGSDSDGDSPSTSATPSDTASASAEPSESESPSQEPIDLDVVSLLPGSDKSAFDAFDAQIAQFEAKYPYITVKGHEYEWKADTFATQLAGGTLPDVFEIPTTDGKTLIENGQIADLDAQFRTLPYADQFNPNVLQTGTGTDGHVYAIPAKSMYAVALHYNRALFEAAGLDPDAPPTTWDEVRRYAKQIADKTGKAGFVQMTQSNTGGWQLTVDTVARGGRVETIGDDGLATATLDNDGTKAALQFLHDLRWEDNSMGSNFLLDWGTINQAFGAGTVGMYTSGSDVYTSLVQSNGVKPETYGMTAIPTEGTEAGVLGGGTLAAVRADADDATKDAAVKWIDFYYLSKFTTQEAAVNDAKTLSEADQPVGTPTLPIFSKELYLESQAWVADYINVPLDQMSGYTDQMFDQAIVDQPPLSTQELYAALDPVVQKVLTDKNADIDSLLANANKTVQDLLDKNAAG